MGITKLRADGYPSEVWSARSPMTGWPPIISSFIFFYFPTFCN